MEAARMRCTMEVNLAFTKAFLRRNLRGWMPSLAIDSQGPTIQQRKCLAFSLPDARAAKWNLKRLSHWLWLPAFPVIVWTQAVAERGKGRMKKMKFLNRAHQGSPGVLWCEDKAWHSCHIRGRTVGPQGQHMMIRYNLDFNLHTWSFILFWKNFLNSLWRIGEYLWLSYDSYDIHSYDIVMIVMLVCNPIYVSTLY